MKEVSNLKERLREQRPASWETLPDIPLYMDQVLSLMSRQTIRFGEEDALTAAMVNNYIKDGALPRADGKRYSRTHLAYLTAICALKQVLSVKDAGALLAAAREGREPEGLYELFRQELDRALDVTAGCLDAGTDEEDLPRLALALALRSYADKLACERVLEILRRHASAPAVKPEKTRRKKDRDERPE